MSHKKLLPSRLEGFRVHMVGIKGTGMTALAELLVSRGASITGSDVPDEFYTDAILKSLGIHVRTPFSEGNLDADAKLVIHSAAYKPQEHPELISAATLGIPVLRYSDALGELSSLFWSCGVAGVHGKTTTTGMVGTLLKNLDMPASVLAGSAIASFGDRCTMLNGTTYFVAETCEYQHHFMAFHPKKIILTSIESDHQDCFPDYSAILAAFMQYINLLPQFGELIYCADDPGACEAARMVFPSRPDLVYTAYGVKACGDYQVRIKGVKNERLVFTLKGFTGEFKLPVPGEHNARNAAAAVALCASLLREAGRPVDINSTGKMREALEQFRGSKRRTELLGEAAGVLFIDDYGHHPTAIKTTLSGLKQFYPGRRIVVDFMSHTYTRTAALLDGFARCFSSADEVILHKIYASARETYSGDVTGQKLYEAVRKRHKRVSYYEEVMDAREYLASSLKKGDLLVTMGAGDNWKLGRSLYEDFLKIVPKTGKKK